MNEECECELQADESISYVAVMYSANYTKPTCVNDEGLNVGDAPGECSGGEQSYTVADINYWPNVGFGPCNVRVGCGGTVVPVEPEAYTLPGTRNWCAASCGDIGVRPCKLGVIRFGEQNISKTETCIFDWSGIVAGTGGECGDIVVTEAQPCSLGC